MSVALTAGLVKQVIDLFKSGKSPEEIQKETQPIIEGYTAELASGDKYTRRARPTLIYVCIFIIINDWIIRPYINLFFEQNMPLLLTEQNFSLMIALLSALGLARSVLDKQGKWVERLAGRLFKEK